tara:strand:- start:13044 stop:13217 length:174 start_codon:yes stop_codon:yes gene_type:complete
VDKRLLIARRMAGADGTVDCEGRAVPAPAILLDQVIFSSLFIPSLSSSSRPSIRTAL